jgi:hypothetical protein
MPFKLDLRRCLGRRGHFIKEPAESRKSRRSDCWESVESRRCNDGPLRYTVVFPRRSDFPYRPVHPEGEKVLIGLEIGVLLHHNKKPAQSPGQIIVA